MPCGNMGGGTYRRQSRGGGETGEETVEDRKTTDLPAVRESERPKTSASPLEIPMILNALVFHRGEADKGERQEHQPRGESSTPLGCRRKLYMWSGAQVGRGRTLHDGRFPVGDWLWMPSWKFRLSQERSCQIVRPRSLKERTSSRGLVRRWMGGFSK